MLLWLSSGDLGGGGVALLDGGEDGEDSAAEVAFEEAHGLAFGLAAGQTLGHVVTCFFVVFQAGDDDAVEGGVALPVPAAVEPVPVGLAGGRGDRGGPAQVRER